MKTSLKQAQALEYLLKKGWSLQGAMHYVKSFPEFVKVITENQEGKKK